MECGVIHGADGREQIRRKEAEASGGEWMRRLLPRKGVVLESHSALPTGIFPEPGGSQEKGSGPWHFSPEFLDAGPRFNQRFMSDETVQQVIDREHLRLLSLGYLISGGMSAFFSLFGLVYVGMALFLFLASSSMGANPKDSGEPSPTVFALIFALVGFGIFMLMSCLAALKFRTAWCLRRRRSHSLCLVVAGISCLGVPYGTALGVFSFLTLARPSVKALFDRRLT